MVQANASSSQTLRIHTEQGTSNFSTWIRFHIVTFVEIFVEYETSTALKFTAAEMSGVGQAAIINQFLVNRFTFDLASCSSDLPMHVECLSCFAEHLIEKNLTFAHVGWAAQPTRRSLHEDLLFSKMTISKTLQWQHGVLLPVLLCTDCAHSCWERCLAPQVFGSLLKFFKSIPCMTWRGLAYRYVLKMGTPGKPSSLRRIQELIGGRVN